MSYLKFDRTLLMNLEKSLSKEFLRTNRNGSYMSSSVVDCNTRKYHGYLVTPVPEVDGYNVDRRDCRSVRCGVQSGHTQVRTRLFRTGRAQVYQRISRGYGTHDDIPRRRRDTEKRATAGGRRRQSTDTLYAAGGSLAYDITSETAFGVPRHTLPYLRKQSYPQRLLQCRERSSVLSVRQIPAACYADE